MEAKARITVWSDYVCPFCYLEAPVLERIRREFGDAVDVDWRAFELRPEPEPTLDPDGAYLHTVWNRSVYPMARERGMTLRLPPVQPRSRRALELAELAREKGRFDEVHDGLFRAFFEQGKDIDDLDVLADVAAGAGLDPVETRAALEQGTYRERVLHDQGQAAQLGIRGVPAMVIHRPDLPPETAVSLSGAMPYEAVRSAVERLLNRP
jgi:predicted DsbA family dithiol-disulfide isomerase